MRVLLVDGQQKDNQITMNALMDIEDLYSQHQLIWE